MDILDKYNKDQSSVLSGNQSSPGRSGSLPEPDEGSYRSHVILGAYQTPQAVKWILKYSGGMIKNERQAAAMLLAVAGIIGLISIFLFWRNFRAPTTYPGGPGLTPEQVEQYRRQLPF